MSILDEIENKIDFLIKIGCNEIIIVDEKPIFDDMLCNREKKYVLSKNFNEDITAWMYGYDTQLFESNLLNFDKTLIYDRKYTFVVYPKETIGVCF